MDSLSQQKKQELEKAINIAFDGTDYFVSDLCLNLNGNKGYRKLGNFIIMPLEFIKKYNGRGEEVCVRARGYTAGGKLPEVTLPLKDFEGMGWITAKWGFDAVMAATHNVTRHMFCAAQLLGQRFAKDSIVYTHMGWKYIDDAWVYLYNNGAIGKENIIVELEGNLTGYTLPASIGDYRKAVEASYALREVAPYDVSIPLLALGYLCPLNEFLKQAKYEPAFITMLVGPTGSMKSTLAALVLNHFGEFSSKSLPGSFKDTLYALEVKGFALKDCLNVIDDYYPATQRGDYARMAATVQSLLRSYGDRSARGRLGPDITLRDAHVPRGNLLMTGEDIPSVAESGLARLFLLEIAPGGVDKEALSGLQENAHLLGQSMRGYIEWLLPQANGLKDILAEKFVAYRQKAQKDEGHLRIAETIAWLQIGYEMFIDYAIHSGAIQECGRQEALNEAFEIFMETAYRQMDLMKEDTPVSQFLLALNELLATEKCYCLEIQDNGIESMSRGGISQGFIGYEDSEYYYLYPDTIMSQVTDFYKRQDARFPITKRMLLKQLHTEAWISVEVSNNRVNRTKVKNIDGGNQRFIWLKREALARLNTADK